MTHAFIFPGQGSQYIGMGQALYESFPEAKEVFQEIDESLNQNLSKLIFEGEPEELNLTENTQPALMAVSMAVFRVLQTQGNLELKNAAHFIAGHSLGEYSALTAAGAFSLSDAARLLKLRGQAMQKAVPIGIGAMTAIIGLSLEDVQTVAEEAAQGDICTIANDNATGQIVLSGHTQAIERANILAKKHGAKRAIILPVSAPFHCPLMAPAADIMKDALDNTEITAPTIPLISNITAKAIQTPDEIRTLLVKQVTGTVRWRESILWMKEQGIERMTEIGAGKVLCGLTRRIDKEISCTNIETPEHIETFLK